MTLKKSDQGIPTRPKKFHFKKTESIVSNENLSNVYNNSSHLMLYNINCYSRNIDTLYAGAYAGFCFGGI